MQMGWCLHNDSPRTSANSLADSDDDLMNQIDEYSHGMSENIEKSLTNLNVNIAAMAGQVQELTKSYQEFSANFNKQQQMLLEEISLLRVEASKLRTDIKRGF